MINILLNLYNFDEEWCFEILKGIIKKEYRVLIIPFSFKEEHIKDEIDWQKAYNNLCGKYYKDIVSPFLSYGIREENIEWMNYFSDTQENAKEKIRNSDVIFFTGGLPDKMMARLQKFELVNEIEKYPGIVMGSSAGAMIQISEYHITPDEDYDIFSYNKGLDLIKDFDIEVHYEETDIQKEAMKRVIKEKLKTVYAMKNRGGLIVENNKIKLLGEVIEVK